MVGGLYVLFLNERLLIDINSLLSHRFGISGEILAQWGTGHFAPVQLEKGRGQ